MAKVYSKEFKMQVCQMVEEQHIEVAIVAEHFGVNKIMVYRWLDEYRLHGDGAFVGKGHLYPADAELRKLKRENERLKTENNILKKAAAYFAKHPDNG